MLYIFLVIVVVVIIVVVVVVVIVVVVVVVVLGNIMDFISLKELKKIYKGIKNTVP